MKKVMLFAFIAVFAISAAATASQLADGNVSLGQDHDNMLWYLTGYGKTSGAGSLYAIMRKYYTNPGIKSKASELLMSQFGIAAETAESLNFIEYIYNYSDDNKMFSVGYIRYYDSGGELIHGVENMEPQWSAVIPQGPSGLALGAILKNPAAQQ